MNINANDLQNMKHCNAEELLDINEIRKTPTRISLLEIFISEKILSAADVHKIINKKIDTDLVTIYRTLTLFSQKEILREIIDSDGVKYYEIACFHNPVHPHFKCLKCEKLICLEQLHGEDMIQLSKYARGFEIESININLNGYCAQCLES